MSLAQVLYPPPTGNGMDEWAHSHWQHHRAILSALRQVKNVAGTEYLIYPFNEHDIQTWLYQHAQMHAEMTAACGINANDLTDVDFKDKKQLDAWMYLHFSEHRAVAQQLGLSTL